MCADVDVTLDQIILYDFGRGYAMEEKILGVCLFRLSPASLMQNLKMQEKSKFCFAAYTNFH